MTETTTTQPDAPRVTLVCPHCGSADLRIFYSERRVCRVTTRALATDDPAAGADPWPSYEADTFVDIDPDTFAVACDACHAHDLTPRLLDLDTARREHDALIDGLAALGTTWTDIEGVGSGYTLARYAPGRLEWDTGGGDPVRLGDDDNADTDADELAALAAAIARNTRDLMGARQRPDDYRYEGSLP
jgi:hypothetical protein